MKKLLLSIAMMVSCFAVAQQVQVTNLNYTGTSPTVAKPIFTNRVHVTSVTLVSPNNNTVVEFFNQVTNTTLYGTNVVIPAYVSKGVAQSNIVSTYIQADTGITNWYTNAGIFTYMITNAAATNALAPVGVFIGGANPVTYTVDWLCERGLSVRVSTNANIVLYYNYAQ